MSQSAQQTANAPPPGDANDVAAPPLTLDELTRVMDVARTLRKERSIAEQELNREETIKLLREKLREAADLAGDPVTDGQIDAAIENYFDNLHEFESPEPGLETTLASAYVRRKLIAGWLLALAAAAVVTWGIWFGGLIPGKRQTELQSHQMYAQVEETASAIKALTTNSELAAGIQAARVEAAAYRDRGEFSALEQLRDKLLQQESVLKQEYRLMVVSDSQSGVDTYGPEGQLSGYYLIVEAVDGNGLAVPVRIRNAETGDFEVVSKWAEQVPPQVFERVKQDKQEDGIVDAREFGVKRKGESDVEITMADTDGTPLERGRQITEW